MRHERNPFDRHFDSNLSEEFRVNTFLLALPFACAILYRRWCSEKILENGVTEATGTGRRSSSNTGEDETMLPSLRPSSHPFTLPESRGSQSGRADPAPLPGTPRHRDDDPILILEISVDEKEPRPLYYFSDQVIEC